MRSASVIPAIAALLLHTALIGIVLPGLTGKKKPDTPPKPMEVALLEPTPPAPLPVAPAPPPPPEPLPEPPAQPPVKPPPEPRPRIERKQTPKPVPKETPAPRAQTPEVSFDAKPTPSNTTVVQAPPAPPAPAPAPVAKTPVSIPARYAASNRKPEYPRMSRQMEEEGTVLLRVFVQADGNAGTVEIRTSSGSPLLDQSAKNAVQSWRFEPATSDGKPVSEWFLIPIPFKLQN
ncbi:energy transducer TonB [Noviherbaspirillum saxi]|uniref:Protein TonB n=1 Tax=Noviherbaspirillum saxi TaxID=2320863 RepID=A0A3A3GAE9_9BURK|nr:energy transducer TonB [Noviherbaspirillum saxi]RJF97849.1 energy transducer TonB [Noviherbaspirillum saxi]